MILDPSGLALVHSDITQTGLRFSDALSLQAVGANRPLRQDIRSHGVPASDVNNYTRGEAEGTIADAQQILEFCRRRLERRESARQMRVRASGSAVTAVRSSPTGAGDQAATQDLRVPARDHVVRAIAPS
jgi:hypothetical protein